MRTTSQHRDHLRIGSWLLILSDEVSWTLDGQKAVIKPLQISLCPTPSTNTTMAEIFSTWQMSATEVLRETSTHARTQARTHRERERERERCTHLHTGKEGCTHLRRGETYLYIYIYIYIYTDTHTHTHTHTHTQMERERHIHTQRDTARTAVVTTQQSHNTTTSGKSNANVPNSCHSHKSYQITSLALTPTGSNGSAKVLITYSRNLLYDNLSRSNNETTLCNNSSKWHDVRLI